MVALSTMKRSHKTKSIIIIANNLKLSCSEEEDCGMPDMQESKPSPQKSQTVFTLMACRRSLVVNNAIKSRLRRASAAYVFCSSRHTLHPLASQWSTTSILPLPLRGIHALRYR